MRLYIVGYMGCRIMRFPPFINLTFILYNQVIAVTVETRGFKDELILFIADKAINEESYPKIDRLQIVKIIYLLDRLFFERKGFRLSSYNFIKHNLGPFSFEIITDLNVLVDRGILSNNNTYYDYVLLSIPDSFKERINEIKNILDPEFKNDVDEIFLLAKNIGSLLDSVEKRTEVISTNFGSPFNF